MADPKKEHMMIAKRVLRYLKGTLDFGVYYKRSTDANLLGYTDSHYIGDENDRNLLGYTDSDYARDVDDRKSTSDYVFLLSGAAICWSSRKQGIVTLSST
jgi:hypothetical protein